MPVPILGALTAGAGLLGGIGSLFGAANAGASARRQHKYNMQLAKYQAQANEEYLQQYLEWNSPQHQREMWAQAGMNPNLAYSQGQPGTMSSPLSYPDIKPADFQGANQAFTRSMSELAQLGNQTKLANSQVDVQKSIVRKNLTDVELKNVQKAVLEANPLLDQGAFNALVASYKSAASIKQSEARILETQEEFYNTGHRQPDGTWRKNGEQKMELELKMLEQKYNLGSSDQKIKAEVLKSKDFQNDVLEIQTKFLKDGSITPGHLLTFIQLLILKMM